MSPMKTNRGVIKLLLLNIITCGIYSLFFIHGLAKDVNELCKDDGKKTGGLLKLMLFSLITCGIYAIIWWCGIAKRLGNACMKNNLQSVSAGKFLLWFFLGSLLCGIGPLVAVQKVLSATNRLAAVYNARIAANAANATNNNI